MPNINTGKNGKNTIFLKFGNSMPKLHSFWLNRMATIERTHIHTHILHTFKHPAEPNLGNTVRPFFVENENSAKIRTREN